MGRPTINDLAKAAGVSVSTVNRVIGGGHRVRPATIRRVKDAAETIGFYGLGSIKSWLDAARPKYRFGVLLQQPTRTFYKMMAQALKLGAERVADFDIDLRVEFMEELTPQNVASRMMGLAESCDAIGVVAAVHPLVTQAIDALQQRGVPVFALISQLAATGEVHYVGLDNWKVGRTAAWAIEHTCKIPGKLGILVGNYRYRCQEMNESGFRSYFREYAPQFTLLEPLSTFEFEHRRTGSDGATFARAPGSYGSLRRGRRDQRRASGPARKRQSRQSRNRRPRTDEQHASGAARRHTDACYFSSA